MAHAELDELRSVDELLAFQRDVKGEIKDLNAEFNGIPFTPEATEKFAELKERNDEIDKRVKEFTARERYIETLAGNEKAVERSDDLFKPRERDERKDRDIYDLTNLRIDPSNPDRAKLELRDKAMRAVEVAVFPSGNITREDAQTHVANLLDTYDTWDGKLAQMVVRTGSPVYRRAFRKYVSGDQFTSEEQRAVAETRAAFSLGTTGIPIPYVLDPSVIPVSNSVVNPLRAISNVEQIVGANEWRGVTAAAITAARAAEATEASDNTPTLAQPAIVCSRVQAFVPFSVESNMDWPGMDAALSRLFADAKDDEEATAFNTGNGTPPNPFGVTVGATGTTAASTGLTITAANLYSLEGALAPRFRPRAQFVANRAMYNIIRALDTAGGAQLWLRIGELIPNNPRSDGGLGNTGLRLLGYPVNELSTMPSTVTNGTKIMLLGDFSLFKIIDRVGMTVELIPNITGLVRGFPTGQRGLFAYWRNGSKVIDAVGFRALTGTT